MRHRVPVLLSVVALALVMTSSSPAWAQRVLLAESGPAGTTTSLVDLATGATTSFPTEAPYRVLFSADGTVVFWQTYSSVTWRARVLATGLEVALPANFRPVAVHPRELALFGILGTSAVSRLDSTTMTSWPACDGGSIVEMAVPLDAQSLFVLCQSGTLAVIDAATGLMLRKLPLGPQGSVRGLVLGPDATEFLTLRETGTAPLLTRANATTGVTSATGSWPGVWYGDWLVGSESGNRFVGGSCQYLRGLSCAQFVVDFQTLALSPGLSVGADEGGSLHFPPENLDVVIATRTRVVRADTLSGAVLETVSAPPGITWFVALAWPPLPPALDPPQRMGRSVNLTWTLPAHSPDVTGYVLEVGSRAGAADLAAASLGRVTSFAGPDVPPGRYFVRVRAVNANGTSAPSNDVVIDVP